MHSVIVRALFLATALSAVSALGDTFTVTNTDDSGEGSLRAAMTSAQDCTGSPHAIVFDVPLASLTSGVAVITPLTPLPNIVCSGTTIDGTTQTTNQGNTNDVTLGSGGTVGTGADGRPGTGDEATLPQLNGPEVEIDGSNLTGSTLTLQADFVVLRGLSIHGGGDFSGVGSGTANITVESGAGVLIEGNVIGATATSYTAPAGLAQTQSNLILLIGVETITIQDNLLGFARWRSLLLTTPTEQAIFQRNEITGSFDGIDYNNSGSGPSGTVTVTENFLHDFVDNGSGSTIFGMFVTLIGLGTSSITENTLDNTGTGIIADVAHPITIQHNIISNGTRGVTASFITAFMPTRISQNSIFGNTGLGIDLGSNGVTPNDPDDSDVGPNGLQNFPVITKVDTAGGTVGITGTLTSTASTTFHLEFFANDVANASGFGEGQTFLGAADVMTDSSGEATFDESFSFAGPVKIVTATATDPAGNTSEFSPAFGIRLLNISTRLNVLTDDSVLIGGFIVTGESPKMVVVRAIGPSLALSGLSGVLENPILELHQPDGSVITNDDWQDSQQTEIEDTGLAPNDDLESAIVATLEPGGYTAIVRGTAGGTGVGLVEVYDIDESLGPILANISTRGFVDTGDNVMIGGFIVGPTDTGLATVLVRAIGPALGPFGIPNPLLDPFLELRDGAGTLLSSNDDWKDSQETEIAATGIPPTEDAESAILASLPPGAYTAIVKGAGDTTGVGLMEVYNLD